MFGRPHHLPVYECYKHCHQRAKRVKNAVSNVNFHVEAINENTAEDENRDDIDDEAVASPGGSHVEIIKSAS